MYAHVNTQRCTVIWCQLDWCNVSGWCVELWFPARHRCYTWGGRGGWYLRRIGVIQWCQTGGPTDWLKLSNALALSDQACVINKEVMEVTLKLDLTQLSVPDLLAPTQYANVTRLSPASGHLVRKSWNTSMYRFPLSSAAPSCPPPRSGMVGLQEWGAVAASIMPSSPSNNSTLGTVNFCWSLYIPSHHQWRIRVPYSGSFGLLRHHGTLNYYLSDQFLVKRLSPKSLWASQLCICACFYS